MINVKALIIHLDRAVDRLKQVKQLSQSLPCATETIVAVDSASLADDVVQQFYQRKLYRPYYPFRLSKNEIACFLSHRAAWQRIVDDNLDAGFVLEDDVKLHDGFLDVFEFSLQHVNQDSFIRFPFRVREQGKIIAEHGAIKLIKPSQVGLGQVAQLIGKNAAQHLLDMTAHFDRPVDTTMQMYWQTGVHPLVVLPPVVEEISRDLGGSTIKKPRGFLSRLYREVARPLYRHKIKVLSQRKDG